MNWKIRYYDSKQQKYIYIEKENDKRVEYYLKTDYCEVTILPRMPYCDRGKYNIIFSYSNKLIRYLEYSYYFDLDNAKKEVETLLNKSHKLNKTKKLIKTLFTKKYNIKIYEKKPFYVLDIKAKNKTIDLDGQDGFPRYYLNNEVLRSELIYWLYERKENVI